MGNFQVIFMDAGQGDCTLIVYPDGSLTLIDCGSTKSGASAFTEIKTVMDNHYSKDRDFSLVLTHGDEDHYNLLRELDIHNYIFGSKTFHIYYGCSIARYSNNRVGEKDFTYDLLEELAKPNLQLAIPPGNTTSTTPDELLSRAGVNVTILAANCTGQPGATSQGYKNANSIVLLVEYKGAKIFLMGDATEFTEDFIIESFTNAGALSRLKKKSGETVVLKMGHHGSETSTSKAWVELIEPDIITVSAGTKSFSGKGMPSEEHLADAVSYTKLIDDGINQSYVVFDDNKRGTPGKDFKTMPKTTKAIWATCYNVEWKTPVLGKPAWYESGQTWYYGVDITGKKVTDHWYGYTGYEI